MSYSDEDLLSFNLFEGDMDIDLRIHTSKLVTVRKPHPCMDGNLFGNRAHFIMPGEKARLDVALFDGEWKRYYVCVPCMKHWLDTLNGV